jgi:hypothetical protein
MTFLIPAVWLDRYQHFFVGDQALFFRVQEGPFEYVWMVGGSRIRLESRPSFTKITNLVKAKEAYLLLYPDGLAQKLGFLLQYGINTCHRFTRGNMTCHGRGATYSPGEVLQFEVLADYLGTEAIPRRDFLRAVYEKHAEISWVRKEMMDESREFAEKRKEKLARS